MASAAVLTISDSRAQGVTADLSGPAAVEILTEMGIAVTETEVIPDEANVIREKVRTLTGSVSLIITTGGTGIADRDVTPEAIEPLYDRALPGFGEIMRTGSYAKTPMSIISRGGAGIAGRTLIILLPGSPKAVRDGLGLLGPAIRHILKFLENKPVDCEQDSRPDT